MLLGSTGATAQLPAAPAEARPAPASAAPAFSISSDSQNPFLGSRAEGQPTPGVLQLSLLDAIDRGLRHNLGLLLSEQQTEYARGQRWRALSDVLPTLNARFGASLQQINLQSYGIPLAPGQAPVVGPFGVFDVRGLVSAPVIDLHALNAARAGAENVRAADATARNARELVVLAVGGTYLNALAAAARVAAAQAEFNTADTLARQAVDMKSAGVIAGIDVLRAQVEAQARQQHLLAARNEFEKSKLTLARVIGVPVGQPSS